MKILVTGGAGFIGSAFVRGLLDGTLAPAGEHEVIVLDALTYAGNLSNLESVNSLTSFEFVKGNILDGPLIDDLATSIDAIVHFAAESHVDRSIENSDQFFMTNVLGTQKLLESAKKHHVERFVHISTDEVYGSISSGSWNENSPLLPNSPYAASKASSDLVVRAFHQTYGLDTVLTRCSNNYGPFQYPEKVIPLFVTNLMDAKKVPLYGDGRNSRDWLHVDDHCRGIYLALTKGKSGEIYNIGGGVELTNRELTDFLVKEFGFDWDMVESVSDRLGHDLRYSVDISKIHNELGYEPQVNFDQGISETISWYQSNRSWWEPLKNI